MLNILAVMAGGSIGALSRHGLFLLIQRFSGPVFPAGTLIINIFGSLCIGFLWSLFDEMSFTHEWRLFVFTGLLGSFTTFSTFTRETTQLFQVGDWKTAILYVTLSNVLGVAAVICGYILFRRLVPR